MSKKALPSITLAIFKPDVQRIPKLRKLAEKSFEENGLQIIAHKEVLLNPKTAGEFYKAHVGKFFHSRLINAMISGPIGVYVLKGENAIAKWRSLLGGPKVYKSIVEDSEKLRALYGLTDSRNGFHGCDSEDSLREELHFFFPDKVDTFLK